MPRIIGVDLSGPANTTDTAVAAFLMDDDGLRLEARVWALW